MLGIWAVSVRAGSGRGACRRRRAPSGGRQAPLDAPVLTKRITSSVFRSSPPGVSSTPSSGMQYRQRRLQRSVKLMRR